MPVEHLTLAAGTDRLPYLFCAASPGAVSPAPLVLFLHGKRDAGTELKLLLRWPLPQQVERSSGLPYYFAAPQIPAETDWRERRDAVLALLEHLLSTYAIDPARVVLTGFSFGAAAGWELAAEHPGRFAGFVPVSGKVPEHFGPAEFERLRELPVWAFNGERDERAAPEQARRAVAALNAQGGSAQFTEVAGGDHFIEDAVYLDPVLEAWWLGQRRAFAVA
ncbi:dienelactone hydrolase family protein [Aquabacterium sp. A7-Y]|uniref:carboxylesterase family protein n=1 Tax=Aquabacterium sp. A7-Y TaxID=1349605 RepID=UPI00223D4104|nr:dienelactone hydrolase family protein [Aquabacterium sp. A7-Y]MCW7540178.1 dienelactone hydrolase family protein [Aquabacterium sp. A7-Y]